MWLDPLVERKYLKNINVTTNIVNIRLELLKEKRATENKQVGIFCTVLWNSGDDVFFYFLTLSNRISGS